MGCCENEKTQSNSNTWKSCPDIPWVYLIRKVLPEHFSLYSLIRTVKGFTAETEEDSRSWEIPVSGLTLVSALATWLLASLPEYSSYSRQPWGWKSAVVGLGGSVGLEENSEEHSKKRRKILLQKLLEATTLDLLHSDITRWHNGTSASASLFRVIHHEEEEVISQKQLTCHVKFLLGTVSKIQYLLKNIIKYWLE